VVAQSCEVNWVLSFSGIVCVSPLQLGGLRGRKSTPRIGWEVPVRSHWLESGSWTKHVWDNDLEILHLAMVPMCILVLNGSLNIFPFSSVMYFYYVKFYV
jgi:hypothetical protein